MRAVMLILGAAVLGCTSGCGSEARAEAVDGTLVLEVGGSHASLRESLRAAGIVITPTVGGLPEHRGQRAGSRPPAVRTDPAPVPTPAPEPAPEPTPQPPAPTFFEVALGRNETLTQLASRHLGSGNRYREIMRLNGWSLAQTRTLPIGTMVKIPIDRR